MGNVLSTLRQDIKFCCCKCCKRCRCCCKERCLTEEEKIQIIYDQIKMDDIWEATI